MTGDRSWQVTGPDRWLVLTGDWSWQVTDLDRWLVLTGDWSWQVTCPDRWLVLTGDWSWQVTGHYKWPVSLYIYPSLLANENSINKMITLYPMYHVILDLIFLWLSSQIRYLIFWLQNTCVPLFAKDEGKGDKFWN